MYSLSHFVIRRAGLIAIVGTLLGFVGGYYSVQLYKNLRTDIEELLPTNARSVVDLNEVTRRLESIDNLAVLIFSKDTKASRRFVDDLVGKLEKAPKDVIASLEYRIDRELKFFRDRRALYMELDDLTRIRNYIGDRIDYEKELYNPLNIFRTNEIPEPNLDFKGMRKKYESKISAYDRFPDGYYATADESKRVILVNLPGKLSGIAAAHKMRGTVDEAILELKPESYASDLTVKFTGGVENMIEENAALIADLELSTIVVLILVTAALMVFYRAFRATGALLASLFMGVLWTFGISYFMVGYLNANSAFLGSIVIGNGINFGIIFLARYLEERRKARAHLRAVVTSMRNTAVSTWTAAAAAGLSYGSLTLTGFRGFKQFGVIGLIGMLLCWVSTFTMLPAYLTVLDKWHSLTPKSRKRPKEYFSRFLAYFIARYASALWIGSFALTVLALAMFMKFSPNIIESDLSKLRNKESMEHGSGYLDRFVDEIFQRYLSPIVLMPKERSEAEEIARLLRQKKELEGKKSLITSVQLLDDFIPKDQPQKIKVLAQIRQLLPPKLLKQLSPPEQELVGEFFTPPAFKSVRQEDLPPLVLSKFTEKDGSIGKLVLVEPPLTHETWQGNSLINFIHELRDTADSVAPGTPVAGQLPVTSDMIEAITHDGPRATLFAFVAVVLLVVFLFRNMSTIGLVLFALLLGVTWMAGAILGFELKINFLNFIALPITFGIGVDYGVNIFQRYREEGTGNIISVIRHTGGAVLLASFTTIIGYSSLLIAGNQAFVSFGRMAVLGEITCVFAAVVSLPAYLCFRDRRKNLT